METVAESVPPAGTVADEARRLWSLGWPVALGGLAIHAMFTVDALVAGQLGEAPMAALAAGGLWLHAVFVPMRSVLHGLDPVVAQAFGRRDREAAGRALVHGLLLSLLVSVPVIALFQLTGTALRALGQPVELVATAAAYADALSWSVPAGMMFWSIRQFLQALGMTRPATVALLFANVVNLALDVVLVLGYPDEIGVVGCGWATTGSQWVMLAILVFTTRGVLRSYWPEHLALGAMPRVLGLGVPVTVQHALEVWAFNAAGVMMGWLGTTALAGHFVALNLASLAFMTPFGLSAAAATRVGNLIGAGQPWQRSAWTALGLGASVMAVSGTAFLLAPHALAGLFNRDQAVVAVAVTLLPVAAAFQLFDGTQVVAFGVLRGAGDVRFPTLFNLVGYWVVGLPLGWALASRGGLGPQGVWVGLALGLALVACLLVARVSWTGRRGGFVV